MKDADQVAGRALWERNMDAFKANRRRNGDLRRQGPDLGAAGRHMVVREYAHNHDEAAEAGLRLDFAETLYWQPVLVLPDGKAEVSFDLCDSLTTFQVTAFAHTLDGRLGAASQLLESRLPFTLQPAHADGSDGRRQDRRAADRLQQHARQARRAV